MKGWGIYLCWVLTAAAADLTLRDGRVLRDYQLLELDAKEAVIKHAEAIEGVPLALLPAGMPRVIRPLPGRAVVAAAGKPDEQERAKRLSELRRIEGVIVERRGTVLRVECATPAAPARPVVDGFASRGLSVGPAAQEKPKPGERDPLLDVAPVYGKLLLKELPGAELYKLGDRVRVAAERTGDSLEFGWLLPAYIMRPMPGATEPKKS